MSKINLNLKYLYLKSRLKRNIKKKHIDSNKKDKSKIKCCYDTTRNVFYIIFYSFGIFLFGIFIINTHYELKKNTIIVEPFMVPQEFIEKGYTVNVIANEFIDQLNFVKNPEIVFSGF